MPLYSVVTSGPRPLKLALSENYSINPSQRLPADNAAKITVGVA